MNIPEHTTHPKHIHKQATTASTNAQAQYTDCLFFLLTTRGIDVIISRITHFKNIS